MQSNKEHALDWLTRRGITKEVLKQFSIHWGSSPFLGECIVLPIYYPDGVFSFNKYRRDPLDDRKPKYLYDKGGSVTLFGANHLTNDRKVVVITEGELDALVLWSMNIPAVSSTGGALSFKPEWVELLSGKDIYLCFDNDDAGAQGMVRVLKYLPEAKIIFIPEQPDIKDISDFVARGGDFSALMSCAMSYQSKVDVYEDMMKRKASWLSTRFHKEWLDEHQPATPNMRSTLSASLSASTDEITRARAYPIPSLLSFNSQKTAICPFHKEKTPSLHYYKHTNTTYCFGACGRVYDSIDIYRKTTNKGFKEAVEYLSSSATTTPPPHPSKPELQ